MRSIAGQVFDADSHQAIEIVVVSQDKKPEESLKIVEQVLGNVEGVTFKFNLAQDSAVTISTLRNQAARDSKGVLLAFLDADICLSRNWAKSMTAVLMSDDARVLVSAMQVIGKQPTVIEKLAGGTQCNESG